MIDPPKLDDLESGIIQVLDEFDKKFINLILHHDEIVAENAGSDTVSISENLDWLTIGSTEPNWYGSGKLINS
jgi:hypothetical protein